MDTIITNQVNRRNSDRREIQVSASSEASDLRKASNNLLKVSSNLQLASKSVKDELSVIFEEVAIAIEEAVDTRNNALELHSVFLKQTNNLLIDTLIESENLNTQIKKAKEELYVLAYHDTLTKLPNRVLFQDRLYQAISSANRYHNLLAVMFIDLDEFKNVNDNFGHNIGDLVLQLVSRSLQECVRSSDTVCRWGGDEFIILLPNIEHVEDLNYFAKKILDKLKCPFNIEGHKVSISCSIGISIAEKNINNNVNLINNADSAMYLAKKSGKNSYKFFES